MDDNVGGLLENKSSINDKLLKNNNLLRGKEKMVNTFWFYKMMVI